MNLKISVLIETCGLGETWDILRRYCQSEKVSCQEAQDLLAVFMLAAAVSGDASLYGEAANYFDEVSLTK